MVARKPERREGRPEERRAGQRPAGKRPIAPPKGPQSRNAIVRYFQETRDELRKVTWPTREEIVRLTLIVLGTTLAFAIFLGILDLVFRQLAALLV